MPINPYLIPRTPSDPGTAERLTDLSRRIAQLEAKYGVVGAGATITGAIIQTATSGARMEIVGSGLSGTFPNGGIFGYDSGGNMVLNLIPGSGLSIAPGSGTFSVQNAISWFPPSGASVVKVGALFAEIISTSNTVVSIEAQPTDNTSDAFLRVNAGGAQGITGEYATYIATLLDGTTGGGTWPGQLNAPVFHVTSDRKLKADISELTDEECKAALALRPIKYKLKESDEEHYGFVADEVEKHAPVAVKGFRALIDSNGGTDPEFDDRQGINVMSVVALLSAQLQRQDKRIRELEDHRGR